MATSTRTRKAEVLECTTKPFKMVPLGLQKKEFRVVQIRASEEEDSVLSLRFKHVEINDNILRMVHYLRDVDADQIEGDLRASEYNKELAKADLEYTALSYTWGPDSPSYDIILEDNGRVGSFSIRQNLFDFLQTRRETSVDSSWYWIDQLCIDQANSQEVAQQVGLMSIVYTTAVRVEVWLGVAFKGSEELFEEFRKVKFSHSESLKKYLNSSTNASEAVQNIWSLPYWSRLWIIQEMILARSLTFCLGHDTISPNHLISSLLYAKNHVRENPLPGNRHLLDSLEHYLPAYTVSMGGSLVKKEHSFDWEDFTELIKPAQCFNPLDKVYGAMGLVHDNMRFEVDYSASLENILLKILAIKAVAVEDLNGLVPGHPRKTDLFLLRTAHLWHDILNSHGPINVKILRRTILNDLRPLLKQNGGLCHVSKKRFRFLTWLAFNAPDSTRIRCAEKAFDSGKLSTDWYESLRVLFYKESGAIKRFMTLRIPPDLSADQVVTLFCRELDGLSIPR